MSRISTLFASLVGQKRKALIPYMTAGFPSTEAYPSLLHEFVAVGADVLEIGYPFSDPMADGPIIQHANEVALNNCVTLMDVLEMVKAFRAQDDKTPVVLMGYANPVEMIGYERFFDTARKVGVDGVIIVDFPPMEGRDDVAVMSRRYSLDSIHLVSPTTSERRTGFICQHASGFIYYVSLKGITGSDAIDVDQLGPRISSIRRHTSLPICAGFGVHSVDQAVSVASIADGVVIGSSIVELFKGESNERARQKAVYFLEEVRSGMDRL